MSWISFGVQGKQTWDSHGFLQDILTGGIIGKLIVDEGLKKTAFYLRIREVVGCQLAERVAPRFAPMSKTLAKKALEPRKSTTKPNKINIESFPFRSLSMTPLSQALVDIFKTKVAKRAEIYVHPVKEKVVNVTRKILAYQLEPVCERAVYNALKDASKKAGGKGVDFITKQVVSMISVPIVYGLALNIVKCSFQPFEGNVLVDQVSSLTDYCPRIWTILLASATYHSTTLGYTLWQAYKADPAESKDKQFVHKYALDVAKGPITKKIKENSTLSLLRLNKNSDRVDAVAQKLVAFLVDYYWSDLQETTYLGIPFVR